MYSALTIWKLYVSDPIPMLTAFPPSYLKQRKWNIYSLEIHRINFSRFSLLWRLTCVFVIDMFF
jgi:hypothetical protein